jgi:hypothetical protein
MLLIVVITIQSNRIRAARLWHITQMEPNVIGYSNVLSSSSSDAHNYRTNSQVRQTIHIQLQQSC